MGKFKRMKNKTFARVYTKIPSLVDLYAKKADLIVNSTTPFTPLTKPLEQCRLSLVTTGGVHTREQEPFDMSDRTGDPSYREIPSHISVEELTITHDYYNHTDALADPNLVLPVEPIGQLYSQRKIGSVGPRFFSFMGHIQEGHIQTLTKGTAPEVSEALKTDGIDAVFLTPT